MVDSLVHLKLWSRSQYFPDVASYASSSRQSWLCLLFTFVDCKLRDATSFCFFYIANFHFFSFLYSLDDRAYPTVSLCSNSTFCFPLSTFCLRPELKFNFLQHLHSNNCDFNFESRQAFGLRQSCHATFSNVRLTQTAL